MARINVAATMDSIKATLDGAGYTRVFAYPASTAPVGSYIVGYPSEIDFDFVFGTDDSKGSDYAVFPIWYITGTVSDLAARDRVSAAISGAGSFTNTINSNVAGVQESRVKNAAMDSFDLAGVSYLSVRFDVEIWS